MNLLVVEDDINLNKGICFAMEKEGHKAYNAFSLEEAVNTIERVNIELIILDLNLPDGDGIDFCRNLRQESQVPIIMLTARDMETDEVLGLESGADDYLIKPFSLSVLKARVANALKRYNVASANSVSFPTAPDIVNYGEFMLNRSAMKILKNQVELDLTLTEYKLLVYFMENRGLVLSKEQILSAVWDLDSNFVDENTLAVNVKRLRKKLGGDNKERYIQTVFGVGYKFEDSSMSCEKSEGNVENE